MRQPELKSLDVAVNMAANTTGAVGLLNGLIQGTDFDERVGRQIQMVRLELQLLDYVTGGTGVDQFHRIMVVRDKQANGVALGVTDVLNAANVTSGLNLDNRHRFVVMYDETAYLNASAEPQSARVLHRDVNINSLTTYDSGVAGTVADINTNSLYLIVVGSAAAGAEAGSVAGNARLRFYDL